MSAHARRILQSEPPEQAVLTGSLLGSIIPHGAKLTRPAKILDFGAINSCTIEALRSFFWGRLTILDAIEGASKLEELLSDPESEASLSPYLEELFAPAIGQAYDVVLLWDFAAFLSSANLPRLDTWLDSFVTEGGYAHGFLCHNPTRKIEKKRWGMHSPAELVSQTTEGYVPYQHLRNQFSRQLQGFVIEKSVLMKDGRLEVLLKRK